EKDMTHPGLTPTVTRMLHDKLYEKRKVAALEIEKLVKTYTSNENTQDIQRVISLLAAEFTLSQNSHSRKGGLIGLAACAIALGNQHIQPHLESLIKPVLICSSDPDSRMRYFACESLYNIVKVSRADTLPYFSELFDALSKLSADPDPNVRNGSDLLDRLLKDIVTETPTFDVTAFVSLLRERMYTKKQFTRRFLVQWLKCVMSIPEVDILVFLPELLDPLLLILGDPSKEIRNMCQSTLGEFQTMIQKSPDKVDFNNMANIIITHSQSEGKISLNDNLLIQERSLNWLVHFISLAGSVVLKYLSGILGAILPTLAHEDVQHKNIRETAKRANVSLMKLITPALDKEQTDQTHRSPIYYYAIVYNYQNNVTNVAKSANPTFYFVVKFHFNFKCSRPNTNLPLTEIVDVFTEHLDFDSTYTKSAVIRWITHLLIKIPYSIFDHVEKIFTEVMKRLSDPADDVVLLTLECMAEMASSVAGTPIDSQVFVGTRLKCKFVVWLNTSLHTSNTPLVLNVYFTKFISRLLRYFKNDQDLLEKRSSFIIRQLCALLHAENVFRALSSSLTFSKEQQELEDPRFCSHAIKKLNTILMTSSELSELREKLKNKSGKENSDLFCCLYKSWCHNPVAAICLCLLTQNYQHCCTLLQKFSDFELTVDLLMELDKLVQLLESPIFAYLRLQLLEGTCRQHLTKCLYSLLMLLPQSRSFDTLHHRLNCVPDSTLLPALSHDSEPGNRLVDVDFNQLFKHFVDVQLRHAEFKRHSRLQASIT
uniref:Protein VAC14 homolog n=1 Tax=Ciona intestinalis TaxID=7719 RepID=F6XH13_CIOIN